MTRIKISIGAFILEYEGAQEFAEEGLVQLLENVINEARSLPFGGLAESAAPARGFPATLGAADLSTNTIAQILDVKTGSDLAISAIARVNLIQMKDKVARQEILDEMRAASTYFRETYVSNLSAYLVTLVRSGRVNMVSKNVYSLAAQERRRISDAIKASEGSGE